MYVECPQCGRWFEQDEPWKRICLSCYIAGKQRTEPPERRTRSTGIDIPKDLIQKLIMLCHPDKHNGSKLAVEVTQKLLELRNK